MTRWMYDPTGRFVGTATYARAAMYEEAEGNGFGFADPVEGVRPEATYFADGIMKHRPEMAVQQSASSAEVGVPATFTGVPEGADVVLDGVSKGEADAGGEVELTFDDPGVYQIRFDRWPMMPAYFAVNVS